MKVKVRARVKVKNGSRVEREDVLTRIPRAKRVAEGDALAGVRRRGAEYAESFMAAARQGTPQRGSGGQPPPLNTSTRSTCSTRLTTNN